MNGRAASEAPAALPVTLLGGYLGAGKTTLVNRLLAQPAGARLAVVVNDFGSVNIDAELIASRDGRTISLTNGCVCCTIGDNLALALYDLAERPGGPEHIVVEASGVSDPARIASYAACHPRLSLASIVVVADAESVRERAADKYVGDLVRHQLAAADLIALSKTDLVDDETERQVRGWIDAEVPAARVVSTRTSNLLPDLLCLDRVGHALTAELPPVAGRDHARNFAAWRFSHHQPLDEPALRAVIASLPASVIRAKGIVRLSHAPDRRFVLQLVGRRWSIDLESGMADGEDWTSGASTIVCIGLADQFDAAGLEAHFTSFLPPSPRPSVASLLRPGAEP